ncbi:MAG: type I-E CRISPR-associated protein Cas7/Cse4/CasC [Pseudomonadota bacterium]|nr:type I-E CRISPR-associated protein Cas7/Cse4/CasC [Pelagibaca sp.]MED5441400.1 type I-E CRISPR-associated protein Cas7/Cse4/CasC [Pseudomonadota bacterium]
MSRFIQIHLLTSYPPANLNRDDQGRPKTARMGGYDRLRVSSQSLKRRWRTSEIFEQAMVDNMGTRTKRLGVEVCDALLAAGIKEKQAKDWATEIAGVFGKGKKDSLEIEQLVHVSPEERQLIDSLVAKLIEEGRKPEKEELDLLREKTTAVDIALFGRMLASKTQFNVEAACQVAHAISVHSVVIEDDYFTAVDDLNDGREDAGSSHIGETGFAAGLFYSYICVNRQQLIENLRGDSELADKAIGALIEAAVKVAPSGKQNSFAQQGYASYVLAEAGDQQPRSLAVSYLKPVEMRGYGAADYLTQAIDAIRAQKAGFDQAYGACSDRAYELSVSEGKGNLQEMLAFIKDVSH